MGDYMFRNPGAEASVQMVTDIYRKHIGESLDRQFGSFSKIFPVSITKELEILKQDVVDYALEILPLRTREIERYMDEKMQIKETLSWRLARIPPNEFKDLIHPIFIE